MIRIASILSVAILIAGAAPPAQAQAADPLWAAAEPVWPWEETGRWWEAYTSWEKVSPDGPGWPKTMGEICAGLERMEADKAGTGNPDGGGKGAPFAAALRARCLEKTRARPAALALDLGAYPVGKRYPLGQPFETFETNWESLRVDPELAEAWDAMPPLAQVELRHPISPRAYVYLRMGLRRDLAAWHADPSGSNLPLSDREVDLNEPSLGYFRAENEYAAFTVGRFQVHWSPSGDYGLALSRAVPFHNGAEFALKMPHARYRFLVSSLNPWLEGTPRGDTSNLEFPPGSEEYRQRNYGSDHGASIFHKRIYADKIKTLFAHRLEGRLGPLGLGLTETQIIGGKVPDFRDAGPFGVFHNDFKDGYTNSALSADADLRLPGGFSVAAELFMDDLKYGATEDGNGNTASLLGYLAALRHSFSAQGWIFAHSLHVIRTDPYLYGYLQPLNTMVSRQVLASNYRPAGDSLLIDRYVVDRPVGYARGGDAFDFRYRLEGWNGAKTRLTLEAAWLAKGEVDVSTPYEGYYSSSHDSPTGVVEREWRFSLAGDYRWLRGLSLHGALGWQSLFNQGHLRGDDVQRIQLSSGVAWTVPE